MFKLSDGEINNIWNTTSGTNNDRVRAIADAATAHALNEVGDFIESTKRQAILESCGSASGTVEIIIGELEQALKK